MSIYKLTKTTIDNVVETLKADSAVVKRWIKSADLLRAEGVTYQTLHTDQECRKAFMTDVILLSFTKLEQAIMLKPHEVLGDSEKIAKRIIRQEMGSKLGKVERYVLRAEKEESMSDEERGAKKVADLATRLKRDLTAWIDKVEKAEAVTFSATQMVRLLKEAVALIK